MAKKNSIKVDKEKIVTLYTDFVLAQGKRPHSVYEFARNNNFDEVDFYKFFASFEILESQFFSDMFHYAIEMLEKSPDYKTYNAAQKMSCFYFTFFEIATANRSFVLYLLNQDQLPLRSLMKLKILRKDFLIFVKTVLETPYKIDHQKITDLQNRVVHEGAWLQFLSILKYWMEDTSVRFEKTDVFIEKSVKASFDMVYNVPIESILDFGKFIWKEKLGTFNTKG
ncbi:TetR family transcriptional regulator C-terminal domain-containing protein [Flavobacterium aciduliphilum]|nr:TetR family transcriptional regulator C-terminal domain-containing protein [Flavobacterium aciduliphilum]